MYRKDEKFNSVIPLRSYSFQEILDFYLFGCPVEGTSVRADTFEQRGWKKNGFTILKNLMLKKATPELIKHYYPCKKDELEGCFSKVDDLPESEEFCVFLKRDDKRVMDSLYGAIRNALAHGSFTQKKVKKKNIYFFANYDKYLKAQIRLYESTLLESIKLVNSNPHELQKEL